MKNGKDVHRKVPTAEEYKIHQSHNDLSWTPLISAQQTSLQQYSYINEMNSEANLQESIVAAFYGVYTPSLRLWRKRLEIGYYPPLIGLQLIRCSTERSIPMRTEMQKLAHNLNCFGICTEYFLDDEETSPAVRSRQTQGVAQRGQKRPLDDEYGGQNNLSKSSNPAIEWGNRRAADEGITSQQCPRGALNVPRRWTLGPGLTADEAVLRHAPLLKDMQSTE
ncbi:uncharacterized protein ARB_03762 [Trichophyton benhamiae CBS 112371]|uniref:Uncharacterized protein n=1 Tax=Arthroderma benhamiae (strain ATCC MYA-4681 / CBS 112371) TaxID=663331 RepID=D4B5M2_ARTBC|nr:uncharacterized protein ARB_03762 [Trichophyton benhamiae CBS 112371]EFE29383.1 hypothetical protein ARB_03762 [Trichophyton benhamiae CBS 112371]